MSGQAETTLDAQIQILLSQQHNQPLHSFEDMHTISNSLHPTGQTGAALNPCNAVPTAGGILMAPPA